MKDDKKQHVGYVSEYQKRKKVLDEIPRVPGVLSQLANPTDVLLAEIAWALLDIADSLDRLAREIGSTRSRRDSADMMKSYHERHANL